MAVTVVKRPEGHKIGAQALEASITDSGGDALVTALYNGLGTGDYVYITSDIDEYNGFWYVTTINADQFKISEYATADFVEYFQDLDIEYYVTDSHDWNSIFLPIVYKCSNNRWPINTVNTVRTISSFTDDNGYTSLVTSGNLRLSAAMLEFVIISNSADEDLNGVWQIVETPGFTTYVIDLPYDAANNLVGASIQYYYNNYQVKVKIYGGLPVAHPWYTKKPYVEVGELSLTPDENGIVMFSVANYIKGQVAIKNNTTIFSYPLNLDAFTGFYIATTESFDYSDGYTLGTIQEAYTDDSFEGYAIAGKLPFKNVYSGDYADYIYTDGNPALWLTSLDRLVGIEDKYFDILFIKNLAGAFNLNINKYVSDYLTATETVAYTDQGIGVYRIPIEFDSVYDSYCVSIEIFPSEGESEVVAEVSTWDNAGGPFPGVSWDYATFGYPWASVNGGGGIEGYTKSAVATSAGIPYTFTMAFEVGVTGTETPVTQFIVALLDASFNEIVTDTFNYAAAGFFLETFTLTPSSAGTYLALRVQNDTPTQTKNLYLRFAFGGTGEQLLLNGDFDDSSVWTETGSGPSWTVGGGTADVAIVAADSKILTQSFVGTAAGNYVYTHRRVSTNFNVGPDSASLGISFYDENDVLIGSASQVEFISGNNTVVLNHEFTTLVPVRKIQIILAYGSGSDMDVSLEFAYLYGPMASDPGVNAVVTQEICIDIIESCEAQGGIVPTDIRLLEDGSYRLLE